MNRNNIIQRIILFGTTMATVQIQRNHKKYRLKGQKKQTLIGPWREDNLQQSEVSINMMTQLSHKSIEVQSNSHNPQQISLDCKHKLSQFQQPRRFQNLKSIIKKSSQITTIVTSLVSKQQTMRIKTENKSYNISSFQRYADSQKRIFNHPGNSRMKTQVYSNRFQNENPQINRVQKHSKMYSQIKVIEKEDCCRYFDSPQSIHKRIKSMESENKNPKYSFPYTKQCIFQINPIRKQYNKVYQVSSLSKERKSEEVRYRKVPIFQELNFIRNDKKTYKKELKKLRLSKIKLEPINLQKI